MEDTWVMTKLSSVVQETSATLHAAGHDRVGRRQVLQGPDTLAELPRGYWVHVQLLLHLQTMETQAI